MGQDAASAPVQGQRKAGRAAVTATVMLASMIYAIDWTIAAVALPHMQGSFSATQDQVSWVITSYLVVSAVMLPTTSWLTARLGRRRLFLYSITGFTIASLFCGAAPTLGAEVVFRVLQGACGAFLIPLSQSILLDTYPPEQHGRAMALWGIGIMFGPVIGPTVGGYLTDLNNWRWVFYINVPVGLLAIFGTVTVLERDPPGAPAPGFDGLGFIFVATAIGSLQLMLDRGERLDWFDDPEIVIEAGLFGLGVWLYAVHAFTCPRPIVDLGMYRDRNYALGTFFVFMYGLLTLAPIVMMPPFLEQLQGHSITEIGLLLSPRGVGFMLAMLVFGRFGEKLEPRLGLAFGFSCLVVSGWMMAGWNLDVPKSDIVLTGFIQGIGGGAIMVPLGALTYTTLDPARRTEAASIWNLLRSVGSSMGIAIAVTVLVRMTGTSRAELTGHITPFMGAGRMLEGEWPLDTPQDIAMASQEIGRQAQMIGYVDVFYASAIAAALTIPLILLLRATPPARH